MDGGVQFQNVAGIVLVAPRIELEIAPKFLGDAPGWREDFFLLATLSSHGRLLDRDGLNSAARRTSNLATLIARSFLEMCSQNSRRPIRSYHRLPHTGLSLEGEFDPEELTFPSEDGFEQEVTTFTSTNSYNAVLRAAALRLFGIVADADMRARLERIIQSLPRQAIPVRLNERRLPSRAWLWQPAYDLAVDILRGFGGTFDPKNLTAPGYIVSTWQTWEDLVSIALRLSFGARNVHVKSRHRLGSKVVGNVTSVVNVTPDYVIAIDTDYGRRAVVVDAKYKGSVDRGSRTVSSSDTYEALAFSRATGANEVVLVYPTTIGSRARALGFVGSASEFANIEVGSTRIRAVEVGVRGVAAAQGLRRFAGSLRSAIVSAS
ncbi:MAG: restriction endonuclease [Gammaproteobacteria bacterium]|nr:restriction endonuclease [Gammaproteobacteria bacterium]